mmetsp:Transcript_15119/g.41805  ORF Transcript_15119/g.41805 Transcript_15119/m.41805 type:complete len:207 (+) Transcript_15119:916-1536(+)
MARGANGIQKTLRHSVLTLTYGNKETSPLQTPVVYVVAENPSFQRSPRQGPLLPPLHRGPLPKKCLWCLPKSHLLLLQHVKLQHVNVHALPKNFFRSAKISMGGKIDRTGGANGTQPTLRPVVVGPRGGNEKVSMLQMPVVCVVVAELQYPLIGLNHPFHHQLHHHSAHLRHSPHSPLQLLLLPLQHAKGQGKSVAAPHQYSISNA